MAFCLDTNGESQYVSVADHSSLDFQATQDFTAEVQFKTSTKASAQGLLNKLASGTGWKIYLDTSGFINISLDDGTTEATITGSVDYSDGLWHQAMLCVSRQSQVATLFVGGTLIDQASISTVGDLSNAATLYVGVDETGAAGFFNGSLAEVRVSHCIRQGESYTPEPWQYHDDWMTALLLHFNEGNGATAWDMSAEDGAGNRTERRNHGTYVGTPTWGTANLLASPTSMIVDRVWLALDAYAQMTTAVTAWDVKKYRLRPEDDIPPMEVSADWMPALFVTPGKMGEPEMATYQHFQFPQAISIEGIMYANRPFQPTELWWLCHEALFAYYSVEGGRLGLGGIQDFNAGGPDYDIERDRENNFICGFTESVTFEYREIVLE